ncbi:DNA (cytosine-5)-methyltransferase 1 [Amycolatopsis rubida]|uniref:DNA (Cytosine-5)-methyltransferase 1 n=2 Tax=Amycolatopsis rubida TaxID=112413 RepID=A0A1I5IJ81_9PSEU|nr:DNA (cytosine-5)-methyltransferase 1 [Amycolatopsis rubida]
MGLPAGWITGVPGLSRAQQLKLVGNGVVLRQAVAAYRYLLGVLDEHAGTAA